MNGFQSDSTLHVNARVALLIDGDNLSHEHAAAIQRCADAEGTVLIRRVYGNACQLPGWDAVPGLRLIHSGRGKNATDILMSIEAMEIAFTAACDVFVLATSDGDFAHLAQRLRERGVAVVGAGVAKAPDAFRDSCTKFRELPLSGASVGVPTQASIIENTMPSPLDHQIRTMIATHSKGGEGMQIKILGTLLPRTNGVKISQRPEGTWRRYFEKRSQLYDLDPRGPEAKVRFLPKGFNGGG